MTEPMTARADGGAGESTEIHLTPVFASHAAPTDDRERRLFRSLDMDNDHQVPKSDLESALSSIGLRPEDRRLRESMGALEDFVHRAKADEEVPPEPEIPEDQFCRAIRSNISLIERALQGHLVIPDFASFCRDIEHIHAQTRANRAGAAADYIPQLDLGEPEVDQFGVALCSIDGQRFSVGDADVFFPVESACKPVNYCLALEECGEELVHRHIGHEPSGASFNELTLDKRNRPHNPMINAGAIMSSSLIQGAANRATTVGGPNDIRARGRSGSRFDFVMDRWRALCGGEKPRFSTAVYLSERETADRNFALAYYMREKSAFPDEVELHDVLDFYFQSCSIEVTADMMAVVAATLANGGICPVSGQRIFETRTVQNCLSMMSACGMYDFSGEFAFEIGLPAKSGVSGVIMTVIPNVMGICTWSPRLDAHGNSVRGIEFHRRLVDRFNFHNYDVLTGSSSKKDPRVSELEAKAITVNELIWAASKGDLGAMQDRILRGADVMCVDYDLRTPLHLAAAEDQVDVVQFYIDRVRGGVARAELSPVDRWGGTPLDDAYRHGCTRIIRLLELAGAIRGRPSVATNVPVADFDTAAMGESHKVAEMIWAASLGDLIGIKRLVAQGVPLETADYDRRTPLHLAAAEGRLPVVEYFIAHGAKTSSRDRWGNTPLDEAIRHDQDDVASLLRRHGARSQETIAGQEAGEPRPRAAAG